MPKQADRRFVAHFDMLGMSSLVEKDPDLAWEALSKLALAKEATLQECPLGLRSTGRPVADYVHSFTFSDTVILFSQSETAEDLCAITVLCSELFKDALHASIPIRGGLSLGRFLFNLDHNLFAGPALIEAYRLGEASQWLGLTIAKEVADRLAKAPAISPGVETIVEWDVPTKSGLRRRHVVNWPEIFRGNFSVPLPITVAQFYQAFEQLFGSFADLAIETQQKYVNTVEFVNARLA